MIGIDGVVFNWRLKCTESIFFCLVFVQVVSVLLSEKRIGLVHAHSIFYY